MTVDPRTLSIVVMGVAGSGKTSVGEELSRRLGVPFVEGDRLHPPANVAKMSSGTPLDDADRWPWLDTIGAAVRTAPGGVVVACSALKRAYRQRLTDASGRPLLFVLLDGPRELLEDRLGARKGHFMPKSLLDSQLATLEKPGPDENAVIVSIEPPVAEVVDGLLARLAARG